MWKKMLPNTLYTIGIVACVIFGYDYGIEKGNLTFLFGAVVLIGIFIVLKIKILKEVKNTQKP